MRQSNPTPRLSREGFVPAGPERRRTVKAMAFPKGCWTGGPDAYALLSKGDAVRDRFDFRLDSTEREAIREICELGSFEEVNGTTYLVAPVASWVREVLAKFEADREDLEDGEADVEHDGQEPLDDGQEANDGGRSADTFSAGFGSAPLASRQA